MTDNTENLDLTLFDFGNDPDQSFEQYRMDLSGPTDSNMTKIDDFMGAIPILLALANTTTSSSVVEYRNYLRDDVLPLNYPANRGFETAGSGGGDLFSSWSEYFGVDGSGSMIWSGSSHSGSKSAYISGSGANLTQYNTTNFWSGSSYTFEFWTYGDGTNFAAPSVFDGTSGSYITDRSYRTFPHSEWKRNMISGSIPNTPVGFHSVSIVLSGPVQSGVGNWILYDDISAYKASGSLGISASSLYSIENKITKIATFSGSGQADFKAIPQKYTHLLIIGIGAVDAGGATWVNVGIDINGGSTISTYSTFQWQNSASSIPGEETLLSGSNLGQIYLGRANTAITDGIGSMFFGIIPNYSGSSGLYKTAMGFSTFSSDGWMGGAFNGGVWKSVDTITRIRVFGSNVSTTRLNFLDYAHIDLYGIV